jgi:hypothetical protein
MLLINSKNEPPLGGRGFIHEKQGSFVKINSEET